MSRRAERQEGIVLAIVLVLIFALITAVYAFQRRAIIDNTIAQNRLATAEADALARGGLRVAEAVVYLVRLKDLAESAGITDPSASGANPASGLLPKGLGGGEIWAQMGKFPLELGGGRTLRITVEDEGARLNLNALVPQEIPTDDDTDDNDSITSGDDNDDAEQYLIEVLRYIIGGMDGRPEENNYDEVAIAQNLIDYMDADDTAVNGRSEDAYYKDQDPPYSARNGPFLSVGEIGLVEGVDERLLNEMRQYVTVHPIGGTAGINLNRAQPWVLSLVYAGTSGERELLREQTVRDLWQIRKQNKIVCEDLSADAQRCVALNDVGNGSLAEGSLYPETPLPAKPSVFRVVAEAQVAGLSRRIEAVYDTRPTGGPQLLSWRRLRGTDSP